MFDPSHTREVNRRNAWDGTVGVAPSDLWLVAVVFSSLLETPFRRYSAFSAPAIHAEFEGYGAHLHCGLLLVCEFPKCSFHKALDTC